MRCSEGLHDRLGSRMQRTFGARGGAFGDGHEKRRDAHRPDESNDGKHKPAHVNLRRHAAAIRASGLDAHVNWRLLVVAALDSSSATARPALIDSVAPGTDAPALELVRLAAARTGVEVVTAAATTKLWTCMAFSCGDGARCAVDVQEMCAIRRYR
jgi:hypothetical protein